MKNLPTLLIFLMLDFFIPKLTFGLSGEEENIACAFANSYVEILSPDTVCSNGDFIVDVRHGYFDPNGATVLCPYFEMKIEVLAGSFWYEIQVFSLSPPQSVWGQDYSFDITNSFNSALPIIGLQNICDTSLQFRYIVGDINNVNPGNNDTLMAIKSIYYKCQQILNVSIFPDTIPLVTCDDFITLSTNYSNSINYNHVWRFGSPSGQIISTNSFVQVGNSGWYYVSINNPNINCQVGESSTLIDFVGINTSISTTHTDFDCFGEVDPPTLSLDSPSLYTNHSFQWYVTINGNTFPAPYGTGNELINYGLPGSFYLVTTDLATGCVDTSNTITTTAYTNPFYYSLEYLGDLSVCQGETFSGVLDFDPDLPTSPIYSIDIFNNFNSQGSNLNVLNDGYYHGILTSPLNCLFLTDTLLIDIDTIPLPTDTIELTISNVNDIYCQGAEIELTNLSYPSSATHTLYINGLSQGTIFNASAFHGLSLTTTGWNDIIVLSTLGSPCYDTLFEYRAYVVPEGCCDNLSSLELLYGKLDNLFTYTEDYLVVDDLTTDPGRTYYFNGANLYFMGNAEHFSEDDGYGGFATGPNILLNDSTFMDIRGYSFLGAWCDTMWGGILLNPNARIEYDASILQDSYFGIRPSLTDLNSPNSTDRYFYNGSASTFHNNYISLTYYSNSNINLNGIPLNGYIAGDFTCDPETMKFPFDLASNDEKPSYSYKAMDIYEGNSLSLKSIINLSNYSTTPYNSQFDIKIFNHVYGVYLNPEAHIDTLADIFIKNPLVAGIFVDEGSSELLLGLDSIYLSTSGKVRTWQQRNEYDSVEEFNSKGYGVFARGRTVIYEKSRMQGDGFSFTVGYLNGYTTGISSNYDVIENLSSIRGMDYGISTRAGTFGLIYEDNEFKDNVVAINIADNSDVNLDMTCVNFLKHPNTSFLQYGILVEEGSSILSDIGWDFSSPFILDGPAGNNWPVDSIGSNGSYPTTTTGDPGDPNVYLWISPENWYSIYDQNAADEYSNLGYQYHRWRNEFVGDFKDSADWGYDAVYPTSLIEVNSQKDTTNPCINMPLIIYPNARVSNTRKTLNHTLVELFPNPTKMK